MYNNGRDIIQMCITVDISLNKITFIDLKVGSASKKKVAKEITQQQGCPNM